MPVKRVIPCLDIMNGRIVKGINFTNLKDAGDPIEVSKLYTQAGADELVFLNISPSVFSRETTTDIINKVTTQIDIPVTVGGGINSVADIEELLKAGASKISINSAAYKKPELISEAALKFGGQCVMVAIDAKKKAISQWDVIINGGRTNTDADVIEWAIKLESLGASEILLTSMDADGTKDGYDIELTRAVSQSVKIPVIASGGAGKLEHFYDIIINGGADAVLAASLFHYKELEISEVKDYLASKGIPVRKNP